MLIIVLQCLSQFSVDHPLLTSILTILCAAYVCKIFKNRRFRLAPGPHGLPFLGYLPFLEKDLQLQLFKMKNIYGGVISLQLGSRSAIVFNDFKAMKEANNKDEFSGRPPGFYKISDRVNHLGEMSYKDWKETRRFTLSSLRTLGMGKNKVEEMIQEQVSLVVDQLAHCTGKSEVNLHSHLYQATTNTIIYLICGRTLNHSPVFSATVDSYSKAIKEYFGIKEHAYFFPILGPLLPILFPKLKKVEKELTSMENLMWKEIEAHEKDFDESNLSDYMDHFISEMRKRRNDPSTFTGATLNGNSQFLLTAGSDTIRTSVEWAMLYMAKYPAVQEKVYEEIVHVLGKSRPPCWDDRESLPFVNAMLMEVARMSTIAPLGDPHWTLEDSVVHNYDIPKDTYIINNLYAVHMDPNLWEDPEEFKPERFLIEDNTKCIAPEYLIPFSYGKRMCPGEKLANVSVFMFVASLLQQFKIVPPSSGLNMDSEFMIVVKPKSPFVKIVNRE